MCRADVTLFIVQPIRHCNCLSAVLCDIHIQSVRVCFVLCSCALTLLDVCLTFSECVALSGNLLTHASLEHRTND